MASFSWQLRMLLWKNYKLLSRKPIRIVAELVWPLILFLILMWVKLDNNDLRIRISECHFDVKAMPSAGLFSFFKGAFCTANNTCHSSISMEDRPGYISIFNKSLAYEMYGELERLLMDTDMRDTVERLINDSLSLNDYLQMALNSGQECLIPVNDIVTESLNSSDMFTNSSVNVSRVFVSQLLESSIRINTLLSVLDLMRNGSAVGSVDGLEMMIRERLCHTSSEGKTEWNIFILSDIKNQQTFNSELCLLDNSQLIELAMSIWQHRDTSGLNTRLYDCASKLLGDWNAIALLWTLSDMRFDVQTLTSRLQESSSTFGRARELFNVTGLRLESGNAGVASVFDIGNTTKLLILASALLCNNDLSRTSPTQQNSVARNMIERRERLLAGEKVSVSQSNSSFYNELNSNDSAACARFFTSLENSDSAGIRILWRQFKPLIRGKIPYTPNSRAVRLVIEQANSTFSNIAKLEILATEWKDITQRVRSFMTSDEQVQRVRLAVDVMALLNPSNSVLESLKRFLRTRPINDYLSNATYEGGTAGRYNRTLSSINWEDVISGVDAAADVIKAYLPCFEFDKFEPYATEEALVNSSIEYMKDNLLWAGLVFEESSERSETPGGIDFPTYLNYKIRMDTDRVDSTYKFKVLDKYWSPGPRRRPLPDMKYLVYGFSYLQDMIEHSIIKIRSGADDIGIYLQQFPYPCYIEDKFTLAVSRSMPMLMVLAWIFSVAMTVKGIVYEKELRLKEAMKAMGLANAVHWTSWFITAFTMMFISICLLVFVLKVGLILEHSDAGVVFLFLIMFAVATISQCFMYSTFFSRANLASACAAIFYFIGYLPYPLCVQWEEYMENWHKSIASLSSSVAFGFGCSYLARYEEQGVGIQWHNVASSPIPEDNFSMAHCLVMMGADAIIYFLITAYIEAVFPGHFGMPRPWYFFLTRSYWCGDKTVADWTSCARESDLELNSNPWNREHLEEEPKNLRQAISVRGLSKVYKHGGQKAIDNLTLNFYEDQITSFLGHNGAGKTTTMSILTGLFPPSDGTACVYGKDIRYEMDSIHQDMGMCPQHNVLFDSLTVEEHLLFYGSLKGVMSNDQLVKETTQMIIDVGLPHKRNMLTKTLSGGMKRKLSVAIAFTGGSKTVILDEPTAGVDPHARRSIWDLLFKYKKGRTIILSTHFMDEADMLGDRIAIIAEGRLVCCGSSLFLKRRYGSGYYLTLTSSASSDNNTGALPAIHHPWQDEMGVMKHERPLSGTVLFLSELINRHVPDAALIKHTSSGIVFRLPDDETSVSRFSKLFSDLDSSMLSLGISGYGVTNTTLEEVFLRVTQSSQPDGRDLNKLNTGATATTRENRNLPTSRPDVDSSNIGPDDSGEVHFETTRSHWLPRRLNILQSIRRFSRGLSSKRQRRSNVDGSELEEISAMREGLQDELEEKPDVRDSAVSQTFSNGSLGSRVRDGNMSRGDEPVGKVNGNSVNGSDGSDQQLSGARLIAQQFRALYIKRFHYVRRSKKAFVSQIILPPIFICLAMIFSKLTRPVPDMPAMEIHPWLMTPLTFADTNLHVFYSVDDARENWTSRMEEMLLTDRVGMGTRCMDPSIHSIRNHPCMNKTSVYASRYPPMDDLISDTNDYTPSCSCSTGYQQCPADVKRLTPGHVQLPTTDYLHNMTGRNISDWIAKTTQLYIKKRYGGITFGYDVSEGNLTGFVNLISHFLLTFDKTLNLSLPYLQNASARDIAANIIRVLPELYRERNVKVWFNNKGYASMVAYMNGVNNMMLRLHLSDDQDPTKYGITAVNEPMNRTNEQLLQYSIRASGTDALIAISVIFAMSQIPASFVVFLIEERYSGSKHLQFVSGVHPVVYWLVNFVWDMCNYAVSALLCILLFIAFQQSEYVSPSNAPCLIALLFLYGWAATPMMYPVSFIFDVSSTAFVAMGCFNIFLGLLTTISTFILELFMEERLDRINDTLMRVFLVIPHFCLGRGLIDMTRNQLISDIFKGLGENLFESPFNWDLVGKNLLCLFILGVLFFLLTLAIEYKFAVRRLLSCFYGHFNARRQLSENRENGIEAVRLEPGDKEEDVDVSTERYRVMSGHCSNDILTVENLSKIYGDEISCHLCGSYKRHQVAVNRICVGVHGSECFGLLGVNGAGKTTAFKMLTGDVSVTSGTAHLDGHSILTDIGKVHQRLGYCPQFDAIFSLLTVDEHLRMYARLRGYPERHISKCVHEATERLGLRRYTNCCAGDLSGGNKRKLSTAIALVGNPLVIFLDEPTTGMDPGARRFLWNCITDIVSEGRAVILTSHSMEECEALCNRLAIMVNGSFKCIGNAQHLKNRFGAGYLLVLRIGSGRAGSTSRLQTEFSRVHQFMLNAFPGCQLRERHSNTLHYQLPLVSSRPISDSVQLCNHPQAIGAAADCTPGERLLSKLSDITAEKVSIECGTRVHPMSAVSNYNSEEIVQKGNEITLSDVFGKLEVMRKIFSIEDYSVSQTSLEQVFISFARLQSDILEDDFQSSHLLPNGGAETGDVLMGELINPVAISDSDRDATFVSPSTSHISHVMNIPS